MKHLELLLLLWSAGVHLEAGRHAAEADDEFRLVGGASRCSGRVELKHLGEWRPVGMAYSTLMIATAICERVDCGSAVSMQEITEASERQVWRIKPWCVWSPSDLSECFMSFQVSSLFNVTCTEWVRLLNGSSQCSGRLQVKTDPSDRRWSSVCEADLDLQDAEVVCRELGCGAPSALQGALYGDVQTPPWSPEFQCGGHESALLDCRRSSSARSSCSPGRAAGLTCAEPIRLVGGASRCAGTLESQVGEWRPVCEFEIGLNQAASLCGLLDCGQAVSVGWTTESSPRPMWFVQLGYRDSASLLRDFLRPHICTTAMQITCSEWVRLLNGSSQCSGRLQVKTDPSDRRWSSVCEADLDLQDAEVVCRELGCGAPSALQGALYGDVQTPPWSPEFQCGGHESALLDCRRSGSARSSCSPGRAAGLTCAGANEFRLVGGASRCAGSVEMTFLSEWRPVEYNHFSTKMAGLICEHLDCGSVVSIQSVDVPYQFMWAIDPQCVRSPADLWKCPTSSHSNDDLNVVCSEWVRLLNGSSQCSGRLQVKTDPSDRRWSSVCEADLDLQDAEVVCRELGCGAPSALQGALYGDVQTPPWSPEFQCGGHESALLDCRRSGSARSSCSPGRAAGLTCAEPIRLVGGASRCAGTLELKHLGEWRPVSGLDGTQRQATNVCELLDCGSVISVENKEQSLFRPVWKVVSGCVHSEWNLRDCTSSSNSSDVLNITCSEWVRLLNGSSQCSGRLQVKTDPSDRRWSSVCEADLDLQDAEVVCRELGCGAPSALQGALYGDVQTPPWSPEFQCGGHESALLDCRRSGSARSSCSPGRAAGLTCADWPDIRLSGENSRCSGTLEFRSSGVWIPGFVLDWSSDRSELFCSRLSCGSSVFSSWTYFSNSTPVFLITGDCFTSGSDLVKCSKLINYTTSSHFTCSDLLLRPVISVLGVSEARQQGLQVIRGSRFTISCSIQPQYPGGSFQLRFVSSDASSNSTLPAANHSAHFPFPAAEPAHRGNYTCVYRLRAFGHDFSSVSCPLTLSVFDPTGVIVRAVVLPLSLLLLVAALWLHFAVVRPACRRRRDEAQKKLEH